METFVTAEDFIIFKGWNLFIAENHSLFEIIQGRLTLELLVIFLGLKINDKQKTQVIEVVLCCSKVWTFFLKRVILIEF